MLNALRVCRNRHGRFEIIITPKNNTITWDSFAIANRIFLWVSCTYWMYVDPTQTSGHSLEKLYQKKNIHCSIFSQKYIHIIISCTGNSVFHISFFKCMSLWDLNDELTIFKTRRSFPLPLTLNMAIPWII